MGLFGIVAAIIGTVGLGGAIALAIFAPVLAMSIAKAVLEFLSWAWGTRLGLALIVGLSAFGLGAVGGDNFGESRIRKQWDAANAAAARKAVQADQDAAKQAEKVDTDASKAEADADASNEEAINAYIADLEKRATGVCTLDDADIKRLRDIR